MKKLGNYVVTTLIYSGNDSQVWKGYDSKNNIDIIAKVFSKREMAIDTLSAEAFIQECRCLIKIKHTNIV